MDHLRGVTARSQNFWKASGTQRFAAFAAENKSMQRVRAAVPASNILARGRREGP
jgi:hypothetical protein